MGTGTGKWRRVGRMTEMEVDRERSRKKLKNGGKVKCEDWLPYSVLAGGL